MIAWCGSRADGLSWLSERCISIDEVNATESLSIESLNAICEQHPRRLILAIENRIDYPIEAIQHLQRSWPEVPLAVAVSSWFDGSRRTGLGAREHLSLPWYRWWDGWRPWLIGSDTALLNPWPASHSFLNRASHQTNAPGVIVSNCRATAEGWLTGLECSPDHANLLTLDEFNHYFDDAATTEPEWILWDDTCLDTYQGSDCLSTVSEWIIELRKRFPDAVLLMATSMPRWSDWQSWMLAGANELVAKPSRGVTLSEVIAGVGNLVD